MRWLDRALCSLKGHTWHWPFREGSLMRVKCSGCGAKSSGVVIAFARVVALLLVASLAHAKDCSVTSTGLPLPDYHRSFELDLAMSEAVSSLVPRDRYGNPSPVGVITIETIGNSNSRTYGGGLVDALTPYLRDDVRAVMNGYSKKTIENWGDVTSSAWANATARLTNQKFGAGSVGIVMAYMTLKEPDRQGLMAEEHIDTLLSAIHDMRPNARVVLLADMGYYGYVNKRNALGYQSNLTVEAAMFAERARTQRAVPDGMVVDYFPMSADGLTVNPLNGLTWPCDMIRSDGIHPAEASRVPVGVNQADRIRLDPVFARVVR